MVTASVQALESYIDGANALVFEQNWDKSLKKFEESVTEDPTFAYAYYEIQKHALRMNQREKREQAFRSLMQHLYKLPEWFQYLVKSEYYAFREDKGKQIAVLKMMGELSSNDTASHMLLTDIYSKGNQLDEAIVEAKRVFEIDPGLKDAFLKIGSLYEKKGEFKEALKYYKKYAAQFPGEVKSFTVIGDLYRTMGDYERAKPYFEKVLLIEPDNVSGLLTMANIESDLGNCEGSEKICLEALANAKTPEDRIRVYESLSSVLGAQGQHRKSLEYVRLILDEVKKVHPPFIASLYRINYINKFISAGQKDEAFRIVEEIKSQAAAPYDTLIPLVKLAMYNTVGDVENAEKALEEVDSTALSSMFENNRPQILIARAGVHEMRGEYGQAITAYKKYLEINPADLSNYRGIGRIYRKLKEFNKAEEYLQKSLKTSPFDPGLHYELSLLYIDTKDIKKALEHLNFALNAWKNADPGIPEVEDARKLLAGLKAQ